MAFDRTSSGRRGTSRPRRVVTSALGAGATVAMLAGCAAPAAGVAPHDSASASVTTHDNVALHDEATPHATDQNAGTAAGENAAASALTHRDVDAWLDGIVPASLKSSDIAGATVTVVSDGDVLTTRGYGDADASKHTPVDPENTLFRVGSISKLFTDTAVMQLVESGDLDLDADVSEYVDVDIPREYDDPITLRHLLTHTAGFEERIDNLIRYEGTPQSLRSTITNDPPEQVYRPGTTPAYSNYGNGLVGYIVQQVSGEPFEQYVAEHILDPLGMSSSSFQQPLPDDLAARMSKGYTTVDDPATPFELVSPAPAGALSTTADDMARFMLAQLGDKVADAGGDADAADGSDAAHESASDSPDPIFDDDTRKLMQSPALTDDTLGALAQGPRMTLGFFDESRNGQRIIGHGGDTNVFHSHLQLYPERDAGIFVSLNSAGNSPTATLDVLNAIMHGFTDRYFPADDEAGQGADNKEATSTDADNADTSTADAASAGVTGTDSAPSTATSQKHAEQAAGTYTSTRGFHSTYLAALGVLNQMKVVPQSDGTIVLSPAPLSTKPAVYEEVAPWLWQKVDGQQLISMRVADGPTGSADEHVQTIGFESAFSMTRVDAAHNASLVLPVLIGSALVLLLSLVIWPVGALLRRHYRVPAPAAPTRAFRISRRATRIGSALTLAALAAWVWIIVTVMDLQGVPDAAVRSAQVLQGLGVLAVVPAVAAVALGIRHRTGWRRATGGILVAASLAVIGVLAIVLNLFSTSISV